MATSTVIFSLNIIFLGPFFSSSRILSQQTSYHWLTQETHYDFIAKTLSHLIRYRGEITNVIKHLSNLMTPLKWWLLYIAKNFKVWHIYCLSIAQYSICTKAIKTVGCGAFGRFPIMTLVWLGTAFVHVATSVDSLSTFNAALAQHVWSRPSALLWA